MLKAAAKLKTRQDLLDDRLRIIGARPGEVVNPVTGEVVTACVTIGKLATSIGTTTVSLTDEMERLGLVQRVIRWKEVPMVLAPLRRKPRYFMSPETVPAAVDACLVIPKTAPDSGGVRRTMILVTPEGQEVVRKSLIVAEECDGDKPVSKTAIGRAEVALLHREGKAVSEIVSATGLSRRTVFRRLHGIRNAA